MADKPILTIIGEDLAKKGVRFVYLGPASECKDCKVKSICLGLEQGKMYEIKKVRDNTHDCRIHNGKGRVVEVEKIPVEAIIPSGIAMEGSKITYRPESCPDMTCPHYDKCHSPALKAGAKYTISKIKKDVKCPDGKSMKLVLLE